MRSTILCYHKIDTRLELGFTRLGPAVFRRQMERLTTHDPRPTITFDDGYEALDRFAFPVLAELGMKAIVFVITDFVGRENTWDVQYGGLSFRHLGWDRLGYWQERGIEIQSHGRSHARLTWLSDAEVADDLGAAREEIGRRIGRLPDAISYPFGAVDSRIKRLAMEAGYTRGYAGPRGDPSDPMLLPRRTVYAWDAFAPPLVARDGPAGGFARGVAALTNRFAVGTSLFQRLAGSRYRP